MTYRAHRHPRGPDRLPPPVFPPRHGRGAPDPTGPDPRDPVVTGMGNDPHLSREVISEPATDPSLSQVTAQVSRLARELEARGEPALRVGKGMTRFEATLRAYCVGYLGGLREAASNPGNSES